MQIGQQGIGRQKGSSSASPSDITPCSPFYGAAPGSIIRMPCIERSWTNQGEAGGKAGGIKTPAGFICLVSHSLQLSFPQHLDTNTWLIQTKSNKLLQQDLEGIPSRSWRGLKLYALS